jgi:hypothetical protein
MRELTPEEQSKFDSFSDPDNIKTKFAWDLSGLHCFRPIKDGVTFFELIIKLDKWDQGLTVDRGQFAEQQHYHPLGK